MKRLLSCCSLVGLLSLVFIILFVSQGFSQTDQPVSPQSETSSQIISTQSSGTGSLSEGGSPSRQNSTADKNTGKEAASGTEKKGPKDKDTGTDDSSITTAESLSSTAAMSGGGAAAPGGLLSSGFSAQFQTDPQTGAAVASIPIEVPPGRGGLTPQVVLSYNSMNGHSWLGTGWDLTMGYIQRSTSKGVPPHSLEGSQFNYTDDENFMVIVPGGSTEIVYDGNHFLYHAKIEGSFLKYERFEGGNYWEVTNKSGTKYTYGQSASARTGPDVYRFGGTFKWLLEKIEDTKGNIIETFYNSSPEESYLEKISYNSISPDGNYYTSIIFNLQDQPLGDQTITDFRGGFRSKVSYLLDKIETKIRQDTTLIKRYRLRYSDNTTRSLLKEVTLEDKDGNAFPGTIVLNYTVHEHQFDSTLTYWSAPQETHYKSEYDYWSDSTRCYTEYFGPEVQHLRGGGTISGGVNISVFVFQIDMNGDGLPDRVAFDPSNPTTKLKVMLNTGSDFLGPVD